MKKIAVILSGCGVFDGSEIHEAVLTLLAINQQGAQYTCFAPNVNQHHVINHLTGEVSQDETRNVLVESARIARGEVADINTLKVDDFDALILPGGFGAAKNLSDFAFNGDKCQLHADVLTACQAFAKANKAAGYICIAPAMIPLVYGKGVKMTIGTDTETAAAVSAMGAEHLDCPVDDIVIDKEHKLVSTPAYMLANNMVEAASGINLLVKEVLAMA
ncbi:isoprenoid biosynthesis glyoxalase ElbB [Thalassomonas sp. RHCl1]|uniref:isoprenoid biosynthesis glyoxalase ElbB n=1 Tax=Thalassomonas sp. RHCl1 TaxID=2995320 RepID=UPI00248AF6B4|nr:isoprenoid biosynthesis glyoxalase ElbB [Thalassomonas sp. RHCl1]